MRRMLIAGLAALAAAPALAGAVIEYENGKDGRTTIYMVPGVARIDHEGPKGRTGMVYERAKDRMRLINYAKRTFSDLDRATVAGIKSRLDGASAALARADAQAADLNEELARSMKGLNPVQRKMAQQMMQKAGFADAGRRPEKKKLVYRKAGKKVKVGKWRTTRYVGSRGEEKVDEIYTVPYGTAGLGKAEVALFEAMIDFLGELRGSAGALAERFGSADPAAAFGAVKGLPVKRVEAGREEPSLMLLGVRRRKLGKDTFSVPEGFEKRDLMKGKPPR